MPLIDLPGLGHFKDRENAMIAENFAATKDYAAGDYCYFNGTLKKFKTAHAAGAWIGTDAENAKLAHDVTDLKTAVSEIDSDLYTYSKNVFPNNVIWENATFNANGDIVAKTSGTDDAAEAEYIHIAPGDWTISWKAKDLNCRMYVCGYNANQESIGLVVNNTTMNIVTRSVTFTAPANCEYIRIRIYRSGATYAEIIPEELQIEKGSTATDYEPYSKTSNFESIDAQFQNIDNQFSEISDEKRIFQSDKNLLDPLIVGYVKDDGTFFSMASWRRSDYIPVRPGMFIYFYNINPYSYFYYYDSNKDGIGGRDIETPVTLHNAMLVIHQVPANAAYMIVSLEDTKVATCWGNYTPTVPTNKLIYANKSVLRNYAEYPENPCDYSGMDACTFRSGICIGDSITGGGFNYSSGTNPWSDGNVYSYPLQFQKMTGIPMTNEGHSGLTTVQWWNTYGTGGASEIDFSGHDFAIIHLGINDVSYSVPIADTTTAYGNIINALKNANEGIKIFVCTIIPAYADATFKAVYTDINNMVKNFANTLGNVYLCDLTEYGHEYTVSQYTAGHLTAYGYWRMAKDLIGYIGYIMQSIPEEFRFIQFIGTDMEYTPGQ